LLPSVIDISSSEHLRCSRWCRSLDGPQRVCDNQRFRVHHEQIPRISSHAHQSVPSKRQCAANHASLTRSPHSSVVMGSGQSVYGARSI